MNLFEHLMVKKSFVNMIGMIMAVIVLFSVFFLLTEAHHDCEGENCPVCVCIHMCENMLQRISLGGILQKVFLVLFVSVFLTLSCARAISVCETLVSRKIRLND